MTARVAVLSPLYRHAEYLPAMLESLQAQTMPDFECAVVLDGPDPEAEAIARRYAAQDARIRVDVLPEHRGLPSGRNAAARLTTAPWLLSFDTDDVMDPTLLEELLAAVGEVPSQPPYPLAFSPARQLFPDGRISVHRYPPFNPVAFATTFQIPGPCMVARAMWETLGGWDESFTSGAEDWHFLTRAVSRGLIRPIQLAEPRWTYRQHTGYRLSHIGMQNMATLGPKLRAALAGR
jgi:glycosyltransferase involved in cell wall biosynthesis